MVERPIWGRLVPIFIFDAPTIVPTPQDTQRSLKSHVAHSLGGRRRRRRKPAESRRSSGPAAPDRFARARCARRSGAVEVLDRGLLPEAGIFQAASEPRVLTLDGLAADEQSEPFLE
jgi:hypothetical protein